MPKFPLFLLLMLSTCFSPLMGDRSDAEKIRPEFARLTCEGEENLIGLDVTEPLFSWILENNGFNQSQSAYRVLVATSPELLKPGKADMWDSKKARTKESAHQKYSGKGLQSTTRFTSFFNKAEMAIAIER